jgi:hypothetical protein
MFVKFKPASLAVAFACEAVGSFGIAAGSENVTVSINWLETGNIITDQN